MYYKNNNNDITLKLIYIRYIGICIDILKLV